MTNDKNLNLEEIATQCGINDFSQEPQLVLERINALEKVYSPEDLVKIFAYILETCPTTEILEEVIRSEDKIRDKSILPALTDLLVTKSNEEKYIQVRVMCAKAIANLKDTSAVQALLYCLNNKNENYKVRFACADALGKIGDRFAVTPLINVVQDESEKSLYLRESAATALGMLGDIRAIEPLVSILETKNGIIDKFTFLKERILESLGKLKFGDDKRVLKALKNSLEDESAQVRINAIEAIMNIDTPEASEIIKQTLDDKDDEVKKNALIALYNMHGRNILDEVIYCEKYPKILKTFAHELIEEYENNEE